jgi:tetratricopeptide (TPR) repeat protein
MVEIPPSLLERLKARQTILVAGVRASELAGAPGWDELGKRLVDWLDDDTRKGEVAGVLAAGRRGAAFAYLGERVPREALVEVLKDAYPVASSAPEAVAAAARIPWRGVITTGFDGLWRQAPDSELRLTAETAAALDAPAGRFLLELCGSTDAPEGLALGAAAQRERVLSRAAAASVRALAGRRSFVLVGFEPGDPDLALLAQLLAGASGTPHFLFARATGLEAELLGAELGLTVVPCGQGREGTEAALRALAGAWESVAGEARPADDDVAAWLEIWRREPGDDEPRAALARAEGTLREARRWDELVELLLGRVELEERAAQVATLREVARLYDVELAAPDRGFAALEAALRLEPASVELRADVERAAAKAGKTETWGELAAAYGELASDASDGAAAASLRLAQARVHAEELNELPSAIAAYEAALAADGENVAASRALVDLLAREERFPALALALERAAALETDAGRAAELRLQLADLQASRLNDAPGARASYERVLADDAKTPNPAAAREALDSLEKLARRDERWADLAGVLEDKARRAGDATTAARLRRERADVLAQKLGDADSSIRELEAVLAADPDNRAALRAVEKLYEKQGRDEDYLRTIERLADLAESDAERLLLLRRLAAEWEERKDAPGGPGVALERAADALEQILQLSPDDPDAFRALARVYEQARRHLALAEAVERRRKVTADRAESRALAATLGRLYAEELNDPARAASAYADAEAAGDESDATLGALARLHEAAGRWGEAAAALEKLARTSAVTATRTDALVRAAALALAHGDDRATAEARYVRALEIDPENLAALGALGGLYRRQGDLLRAAKHMREAEARTVNRIDKARLLFELGALYQDELHDAAQATELLGRVLEVDPEHVPAAERLVTLLERAERWALLEPVLEMLARKADRAGERAPAAALLHAQLGEAARHVGNLDKAVRAYETAHELAPRSFAITRGFGALREQRKEWSQAAALYAVAAEQADDLVPAERVDLFARLGRANAETGTLAAALGWYEKALALEPKHQAATEAVAKLHAAGGDFAALVADKRALLALATDDEARARLAEEIGDLYAEKISDDDAAITAYQEVLAIAPGRRQTLHKALELYTKGKRWAEVAETLGKLAEVETATAVRAKYFYAAGVIRRDELDDPAGAVSLFNRALDDAPDLTKAFDALERILSEVGAWKELARNYRRMIKRLPAEGLSDLRLRLWSGLGEVSLTQLEDLEMAATALEVAATMDADNVQRREQLADVYVVAGPSHAEKAIAEHQWLIAKNPDRLASYQALAKLYGDAHAYDKVWCVASTLVFLRKAEPELQAFHDTHRPRELRAAKRPFNDDVWLKVVHADEDRYIDAIFILLGQFIASAAAQQHQTVGLRRKDRVDVGGDQRVPTRALRYVAQTLDLPTPDLFFRETEPQSLVLVNLQEKGVLTPALVIGKGIEQRASEVELVFEMAKRMAFLRPERFVRAAVPSVPALDIALRAALALGGSPLLGGAVGDVERLAGDLRRVVSKPVVDQLAVVGKHFMAAKGAAVDVAVDVQSWMGAVDLTSARVGFSLTGDLAAAARVISTEPTAFSPVAPRQRLKDLLAFSVSEEYFAVRKFLGLEVM